MEAIIKSQAAIEVLSGISLAEFLIFFSLVIGLVIAGYRFKDKIMSVFENYHKKASKKEDMAKQIKECNAKIEALEKHHEEDVHLFEDKQLKYRQQSLDKQDMIDKCFDNVDVRFDKMEAMMEELKELVAKQNETIASHYKETERLNDILKSMIIEKSKITKKEINDWYEKKKDMFMSADEALKYGLIDEII